MRVDEEIYALFLEAYAAKLSWAKEYTEMYFAKNRANGVGHDPYYYRAYYGSESDVPQWKKDEYYELRDKREPEKKAIYDAALLNLINRAETLGLKNDILSAFDDAVNKAAEKYNNFLRWRLTDNDDNEFIQINQLYKDAASSPRCDEHDDKAALEVMKTSLLLYIQSRKANADDFFGIIDRFFGGHDKATKLSAAKKIYEYNSNSREKLQLTAKEFAALNQGKLKSVAKEKLASVKNMIEIIETSQENNTPSNTK